MLNKEVFKAEMQKLNIAYPDWGVKAKIQEKATLELWYSFFENYDDYEFIGGVKAYIKNSRFAPTIAALNDEVKDVDPYKGLKKQGNDYE
jgi:hypothetical protein